MVYFFQESTSRALKPLRAQVLKQDVIRAQSFWIGIPWGPDDLLFGYLDPEGLGKVLALWAEA